LTIFRLNGCFFRTCSVTYSLITYRYILLNL
jgi:hypothetical protein